jgi:hypothetical protein
VRASQKHNAKKLLFPLIPALKKMFVSADFHVNDLAPALLNGISVQIECFAELDVPKNGSCEFSLSIKIHFHSSLSM